MDATLFPEIRKQQRNTKHENHHPFAIQDNSA
jgi:hypothetical protein